MCTEHTSQRVSMSVPWNTRGRRCLCSSEHSCSSIPYSPALPSSTSASSSALCSSSSFASSSSFSSSSDRCCFCCPPRGVPAPPRGTVRVYDRMARTRRRTDNEQCREFGINSSTYVEVIRYSYRRFVLLGDRCRCGIDVSDTGRFSPTNTHKKKIRKTPEVYMDGVLPHS